TRRLQQAHPAYADRCKTLHNGVSVEKFHPAERSAESHDQGTRLLFVGRLGPEKGLHTLIEAFAQLAGRYPKLHLDIVGPDEVIPADMQLNLTDDPQIRKLYSFYQPGAYRAHVHQLVRD